MPVNEIRFADPYICRIVEEEQARRGDTTASKTAARMISEYAALLRLGAVSRPSHDDATPNNNNAA